MYVSSCFYKGSSTILWANLFVGIRRCIGCAIISFGFIVLNIQKMGEIWVIKMDTNWCHCNIHTFASYNHVIVDWIVSKQDYQNGPNVIGQAGNGTWWPISYKGNIGFIYSKFQKNIQWAITFHHLIIEHQHILNTIYAGSLRNGLRYMLRLSLIGVKVVRYQSRRAPAYKYGIAST